MFGLSHFGEVTTDGISIALAPEDRPEWRRTYVMPIAGDDGRMLKMTIEMRTASYGDRYDSSELRQDDGKWVSFDARRPAEKILDRSIIAAVETACQRILAIDAEFMRSLPLSFVDNTHTTWHRRD